MNSLAKVVPLAIIIEIILISNIDYFDGESNVLLEYIYVMLVYFEKESNFRVDKVLNLHDISTKTI